MKMKLAGLVLAVATTHAMASSPAPDGTLTFTGALVAETCAVSINGGAASATVALPHVALSSLNVVGSVKGATSLNVALTSCNTTVANKAMVFFEAGGNVNADGTLANTAVGGAGGVALQINDSASNKVIVGNQNQLTGVISQLSSNAGAAMSYVVQYVATNPTPSAGAFASSVTYSIHYM